MINNLNIVILLPLLAGLLLFVFPEKIRIVKGIFSFLISLLILVASFWNNGINDIPQSLIETGGILENLTQLNANPLSTLILLFITGLSILINLFSLYKDVSKNFPMHFYSWFLLTLSAANAIVLTDNMLMLIFFWGILGYTLFKLIVTHNEAGSAAAKKTLIIIGSSDAIMIIGIALLWNITGSFKISEIQVQTDTGAANMAFILLVIGGFTKAGAFPFHTWIPDFTENAHGISSAYLPAALDKLVGIYFLVVLCTKVFILNDWLTLVLIIIGVLTIIIGVMMALIQHNYKKLLGYHAVSQVGYMVLGIGLGSPLGIAAGIFHMINNCVYKSGLFLTASSIERKTGTTELDDTGGLAKHMPISFIVTLIFALSISGIPPFNGFASKWMIYQGIVDFGKDTGIANNLWILWLALAVFGSGLTLASFIKFTGGIFLGEKIWEEKISEDSPLQWIPKMILALICIGFGAFATNYVVSGLFMPVTGEFAFTGIWDSNLLFWLVIVSILLGLLIYLLGDVRNFRKAEPFIGGEKADESKAFPVTSFYDTLCEFKLLKPFYRWSQEKYFDLYDLFRDTFLWNNKALSRVHEGILTTYIFWIFGGLTIILLILIL